jgi:DNA-binding PadR family transcriptional regulator
MTPDPSSLTPLAPRDFLILLALAGGDLHGYGLVKTIESESEGEVRMDPANLYRALRRMKRDGLVQEVTGPDTGDGPDRRYFRLTPLGRRLAASEAARAGRLARLARARKLLPGDAGR